MTLEQAIEKANDIDLWLGSNIDPESLAQIKLQIESSNNACIQKINAFTQQNRFKFKTKTSDFIRMKTAYGNLNLIPIANMLAIDLERSEMMFDERQFDLQKYTSFLKKLKRYVPYAKEYPRVSSLLNSTIERFEKNL